MRRIKFLSTLSLRRATGRAGLVFRRGEFLSTLSLRRATWSGAIVSTSQKLFLSTLSLRRATVQVAAPVVTKAISIHALLAESDAGKPGFFYTQKNFYPRSPCGERPSSRHTLQSPSNFYPRSPCGERPSSRHTLQSPSNFYPRSPCGERPSSPYNTWLTY